jgi:hypothetical protein
VSGSRSRRELGISGGRRAFHALGMITDVSLRLPYLVIDRLLSWLTLLDHAPSFKDSSLSSAVRGESSLDQEDLSKISGTSQPLWQSGLRSRPIS